MPPENSLPARHRRFLRGVVCFLTALPLAVSAWGDDTPVKSPRVSRLLPVRTPVIPFTLDSPVLKPVQDTTASPGMLSRYRMALEKETRRRLDRDPELFMLQAEDEDGNPVKRSRTEAKRIFGGATGRLISEFAEMLVEDAGALRVAKDYVQGISFDVMSGGDVRFKAGRDESATRVQDDSVRAGRGNDVAASFSVIAIGSPRVEMRATLPGSIRAQIELPLTEAGLRATFSRRITSRLRGTFSAGIEDSGADTWATLGLGVKF